MAFTSIAFGDSLAFSILSFSKEFRNSVLAVAVSSLRVQTFWAGLLGKLEQIFFKWNLWVTVRAL